MVYGRAQMVQKAREAVLRGCHEMAAKGYALGTSGNISARVEGKPLFVITPTSRPYDRLRPEDIVLADMEGHIIESRWKPSIEFSLHRAIYLRRPDAAAIVHTHSAAATAAASIKGLLTILAVDIETIGYLGGDLQVAAFEPPGSEALAQKTTEALGKGLGVLMRSHGAIGIGRSVEEAMVSADHVERTCAIYLSIRAFGEPEPLPMEWRQKAIAAFCAERGIE